MKSVIIGGLRLYQRVVSPHLRPACRYVPSCSEYAIEAIEHCGTGRGAARALWRLLRCHPFSRGGYDPVVRDPAVQGSLLPTPTADFQGKQV
jgi:uncharacterized protein